MCLPVKIDPIIFLSSVALYARVRVDELSSFLHSFSSFEFLGTFMLVQGKD